MAGTTPKYWKLVRGASICCKVWYFDDRENAILSVRKTHKGSSILLEEHDGRRPIRPNKDVQVFINGRLAYRLMGVDKVIFSEPRDLDE